MGLLSTLALLHLCLCGNTLAQKGVSGSHTDIPRWCGKPYEVGSPNLDPGGQLSPPEPSPSPMLYVQVQSRHTIYVSSENTGEIIVDAGLSYTHGMPFQNVTPTGNNGTAPFGMLEFNIMLEETDRPLVTDAVALNTTGNLFQFDLGVLKPRLSPYNIVIYGTPVRSYRNQSYTATTELYYLPTKSNGSTVKVDNLYGGMLVSNTATNQSFTPLLPFGFYGSCSLYFNYSLANVSAYKDLGFTAVNPVCAYTDGDLGYLFDWIDSVGLWYQYDLRYSYLNLSSVSDQVPLVKDSEYFLSWYTADEPDGTKDALNSTRRAYDLLKREDPYHPTGLVLNCYNYYFDEYASGADYIMEDAYPVGINATWSRRWNTTVNETYGDCGCDDCIGDLRDVSDRLDAFYNYQAWLGEPQKPLWSVLQASIREDYWARDPTPEESWAMMILSFNHGAKAIMSWDFREMSPLNDAHAEMARVATTPPISHFLLQAQPQRIEVKGHDLLDVAYWTLGGQVIIGVANLDYISMNSSVAFDLPGSMSGVASQPWGSLKWEVRDGSLTAHGLYGLATSFVILDS